MNGSALTPEQAAHLNMLDEAATQPLPALTDHAPLPSLHLPSRNRLTYMHCIPPNPPLKRIPQLFLCFLVQIEKSSPDKTQMKLPGMFETHISTATSIPRPIPGTPTRAHLFPLLAAAA